MKRAVDTPFFRQTPGRMVISLLIGSTVASLIAVMIFDRPANAQGLLYDLRCTVRDILSRGCQTQVQEQPTPQPQAEQSPAPQPAPERSQQTGQFDQPSTRVVVGEPIVIEEDALRPLPTTSRQVVMPTMEQPLASVFPMTRANTTPAVLGAQQAAIITPTERGWTILGTAWYVWAAIIAAITLCLLLLTQGVKNFLRIARSPK